MEIAKDMMLEESKIKELVHEAIEARKNSYSPYSNFSVGAALLTKNGKIYRGCNIENAGFSATVCAERTAVFKAVSEGEREFVALAVVGGPTESGPAGAGKSGPCGVCRQVLLEFCEDLLIIGADNEEKYYINTLKELVPMPFGPHNLA